MLIIDFLIALQTILLLAVFAVDFIKKPFYSIPTPNHIFLACYIFVYYIPLISFYLEISGGFSIAFYSLSEGEIYKLLIFLNLFLLSYLIFIAIFNNYRRQNNASYKVDFSISEVRLLVLVCVTFVIKYFYLAVGLGFNPFNVLDRLLNPREYTYIKIGTGYINYLHSAFLHVLLFSTTLFFYVNKFKIRHLIFYLLCFFLVFMGGGKQNFLWLVFYLIVVNRFFELPATRNLSYLWRNLRFAMTALFVLLVSFVVLQGDSIVNRSIFEVYIDYQREAYYSAKVLTDFDFKFEYLYYGIYSTVFAIVPRAVWSEKPLLGFYNEYWRPLYEPSTVSYHSSTYGFASESYMMFGLFGALIYGFLFALYINFINNLMHYKPNVSKIFIAGISLILVYFFLRGGFFGFTFWYFLILVLIGTFLLRLRF
tara:strand:- start:807 stop:2078 length:1272 start_codon:yes stop_codon:yes gene_type:complete